MIDEKINLDKGEKEKEFKESFKEMYRFFNLYELRRAKKEFLEKIALLIISAFGFITALAWHEALKLILKDFLEKLDSTFQKVLYAFLITVITVVISIILGKIVAHRTEKSE